MRIADLGLAAIFGLGLLSASAQAAAPTVRSVTGYYTASDGFQHAIVASDDGRVREIFFNPQKGIFVGTLGCFERAVAVAGFWADVDKSQHVIVATETGDIHDMWFEPTHGINSALLRHIPGALAIAGFYSSDDQFGHAIVGTSGGDLHELFWRLPHSAGDAWLPAPDVGDALLGHYNNIVAIGAFYAPDDAFRIVHLATGDGNVREIFYHPDRGQGESVTSKFNNIVGVGSFYTDDDHFRHAIVATGDGNVTEVFYHPDKGVGRGVLSNFGPMTSVSGYFTPSDGNRHVIVGDNSGNVHELFFNPNTGMGRSILHSFSSAAAAEDISPDTANGVITGGAATTAGIIVGMAGDEAGLYAVSLAAGVWKSVNGGPWIQLPNSPARASSIAMDPNNSNHLIVGERDDDAGLFELKRSGVWESKDGGNSWSYIFNPSTQPGCRAAKSQAIASVAISRQSTVFITTPCGVGRRRITDATFSFDPKTQALGAITAVTASSNTIWARSANALAFSTDDGASWTDAQPVPNNVMFGGRNTDIYALAAFDFAAYMISVGSKTEDNANNYTNLLVYNPQSQKWIEQRINFNGVGTRDGTGLGGRRFIRAFELDRQDLPEKIGSRNQLFVSAAQDIYRATGLLADMTVSGWERPVGASGPGLSNQDPVHSDLWSFHLATKGGTAWVAGDGGVFENVITDTATFIGKGWKSNNQGLHTHHAHTLTVLTDGHCGLQRVAYATSDNDAWVRDANARWSSPQVFGDANWTDGDAANVSVAMLSRNHEEPWLTGFGENLSNGFPWLQFALNTDLALDSGNFIRFPAQIIQTLGNEPVNPLLDAVGTCHPPTRPNGNHSPSTAISLTATPPGLFL